MSLTSFLQIPEVAEKVKPLRPKMSRKIAAPIKAEPRSNRYMMLGSAFDYLLRFELQRRAPHAVVEQWVAESAPDIIWRETDTSAGGWDVFGNTEPENSVPPEEVANRARKIVQDSKAAVAEYVTIKVPSRTQQADLAAHAIRLAKLDEVYRSLRLDPQFEEADQEDVEDLMSMLAIVPFDQLIHSEVMLLNPTFGEASVLIGGADADLIAGDMLVDFKTTKQDAMNVKDLDQLLGYYLLARHCRRSKTAFPVINRLALYFCRHGFLWTQDVTTWTDHPKFSETEEWFFTRAKKTLSAG